MIEAVLFDLDDTLLGNDIDQFLPHYFDRLGRYAAPHYPPDTFIPLLLAGTQAMVESQNSAETNRDTFWQYFAEKTGADRAKTEAFFDQFYANEFEPLKAQTHALPAAPKLVDHCFSQGLKVVVATNPLFPRTAIEARMRWGNVGLDRFDYDLVTTYEVMHATKPNPAYYREILARIDVAPQNAIMVGDSWVNDIAPANVVGLSTWWIDLGRDLPQPDVVVGHGSLDAFWQAVQAGLLTQIAGAS